MKTPNYISEKKNENIQSLEFKYGRIILHIRYLPMQISLTFDTGGKLVLTELRIDPQAAPTYEHILFSFWRSDFERDSSSSLPNLTIFVQSQSWRYTSRVK